MTTSEKVAYLKGLLEGMDLSADSKEAKLFGVIADILADMASDIEDVENDICELGEDVDAISDDLGDVEDYLYDDEDDEEYEEPQFFEVTCPSCDNTITIDEDVLNLGSIQCPKCGEMMEFEFDEDDEDEDDKDGD